MPWFRDTSADVRVAAARRAPPAMNMAQVVRRLTLPLATTSQQFFFVLRHFPYTGGCTLRDLDGFLAAAIRCCDGGHAAQKRQALTILSGITGLHGVPRGFRMLDIYQVVYELTLRVLDPKRIDQGAFGLCGPAALATLLAKTEPVTYIQLAVELLTTGRSHVRGFSLTPGEEIQRYRPSGTPQADWLVLASLRSSDQALTSNTVTGEYGGTTFFDMMGWLKQAGFGVVVGAFAPHLTGFKRTLSSLPIISGIDRWLSCDFHPQRPSFLQGISLEFFSKQNGNLFLADRFLRNHWKVFLMVSEKYTQTSGDVDPIASKLSLYQDLNLPARQLETMRTNLITQYIGNATNHWVLAKALELPGNGTVRITRYSWGGKSTTAPIPVELFYTIYSGFIAVSCMKIEDAIAAWRW